MNDVVERKVIYVPEGVVGERIDVAISRLMGLSRTRVGELIEQGNVILDGNVVESKSIRMELNAVLEVTVSAPRVVNFQPKLAQGLRVVFEDDDIIVVDKPVGVAAHPSVGWDGPSVTEHLAAAGYQIATSGAPERQGVVQRLDVGTSGLMVLAKSELAYSVLKQAFRDRLVTKTYHALVQGHPDPHVGTIDAPIARHPKHDFKFTVRADGRASITHYETLEAHRYASLLSITLETGRTHQIRVHMSAIKHPCVGDLFYGADPTLAAKVGLDHQWLHAVGLGFAHPRTGEWVSFTSEYPEDLRHALEVIRATD